MLLYHTGYQNTNVLVQFWVSAPLSVQQMSQIMFSGTLKSEASGFSAGHVPNMISCMGYTNEQHIFRLATGHVNRHQEWILTAVWPGRSQQTMAHGLHSAQSLFLQIKFYRNTHLFTYVLSIAVFPQWQNWVVVTEVIWTTKPNIFISWPLTTTTKKLPTAAWGRLDNEI